MTNPEETKDKFYEELDSHNTSAKSKKLIILSAFKARVETNHHAWHRVLGKQGIRKSNSNRHPAQNVCLSRPSHH